MIVAAVLAALIAAGAAPAGAATCPAPVPHPGDGASKQAIARWMAEGAAQAGLPGELAVMGALVESGLTNLASGDADRVGYFGMRTGIWNAGPYAGYPGRPALQLQWFIDQATRVRRERIEAGAPDPAADESRWGEWVADVLLPAAHNRGRYALRLGEARMLIGVLCTEPVPPPPVVPAAPPPLTPAPPAVATAPPDAVAPAVLVDAARSQRVLRRGAVLVTVRCPGEACSASATASVALPRGRTLRLASSRREGARGQRLTLRLTLASDARAALRRALRAGRSPRALVRVLARDAAGNRTVVRRTIRLTG